jgi:hypothetical protein
MATTQAPLPGTKLTEAEFDLEKAKECAQSGPVFLTHDERKTHVFLSIDAYKKVSHEGLSLFDLLYDPRLAEIDDDFEFPRLGIERASGPWKCDLHIHKELDLSS